MHHEPRWGGSLNPYSLLKYKREGVSWAPAVSQMEETHVSIPLPTGGTQMVLDQYQEKKQEQVIKNIISWLQATPEPYKLLDLLSQLWPLLKPPSGN